VTWPVGIIIFLSIITIVTCFLVRRSSQENFTPVYLSSITVKLILSCAFVIIFIKADKPAANYNTVFFLIAYLIFTAGEVIFLLLKKRG